MICVAVPNSDSLDNINKWKAEISRIEPDKPMILILTKSDMLSEELKESHYVTYEQVKTAKDTHGLQGCCQTSSKQWQDFNVHKAFVRTICAGYFNKYDDKLGA